MESGVDRRALAAAGHAVWSHIRVAEPVADVGGLRATKGHEDDAAACTLHDVRGGEDEHRVNNLRDADASACGESEPGCDLRHGCEIRGRVARARGEDMRHAGVALLAAHRVPGMRGEELMYDRRVYRERELRFVGTPAFDIHRQALNQRAFPETQLGCDQPSLGRPYRLAAASYALSRSCAASSSAARAFAVYFSCFASAARARASAIRSWSVARSSCRLMAAAA